MNETISTRLSMNRLELIAATLDHVCAELEDTERLASILKAQIEPGWPPGEYDRNAQLFFRDRLQEGGAAVIGWYCWYAIRRGSSDQPSVLVGAGGYFGPPSKEGVVEIGFSIMPVWQGSGYATELAKGLINNAFMDNQVQKIIAHTTPTNSASCKVLDKCGFNYIGRDEESGNNLYAIMRN
ncbi:MAG TPA: GNAT family N-acetyltransferase [Deltaproteobacteria bacterium]|nr:GNAT family N-acetyltransferase [Deltaproteobacteria bacterium]